MLARLYNHFVRPLSAKWKDRFTGVAAMALVFMMVLIVSAAWPKKHEGWLSINEAIDSYFPNDQDRQAYDKATRDLCSALTAKQQLQDAFYVELRVFAVILWRHRNRDLRHGLSGLNY
jgi:hypothetical protein